MLDPEPNCPRDGPSHYVSGTTVRLTAEAYPGFYFKEWWDVLNDVSLGTAPVTTVSTDSNKSLRADFQTCFSLYSTSPDERDNHGEVGPPTPTETSTRYAGRQAIRWRCRLLGDEHGLCPGPAA